MAFNENLKKAREMKGQTCKDVSTCIGVTETTYNKYELGTTVPKIDTVIKIADYLDVSLDYLFDHTIAIEYDCDCAQHLVECDTSDDCECSCDSCCEESCDDICAECSYIHDVENMLATLCAIIPSNMCYKTSDFTIAADPDNESVNDTLFAICITTGLSDHFFIISNEFKSKFDFVKDIERHVDIEKFDNTAELLDLFPFYFNNTYKVKKRLFK